MEKEFVPYELAVKLKALGFDEPCFGYYVDSELRGVNLGIEELGGVEPYYQRLGFHTLSNHDIDNPNKIVVTAPTFSQIIDFLYIYSNKQIDIELKGRDSYEERVRKVNQGCKDLRDLQNSKSNK